MLYNSVVRPDYKQHGCSENVDDPNNDGDVASGTSGPDNFAKLELPRMMEDLLKKNGWKSPGDRKVVSAAKKQVLDSKKSEFEASSSTATNSDT